MASGFRPSWFWMSVFNPLVSKTLFTLLNGTVQRSSVFLSVYGTKEPHVEHLMEALYVSELKQDVMQHLTISSHVMFSEWQLL